MKEEKVMIIKEKTKELSLQFCKPQNSKGTSVKTQV